MPCHCLGRVEVSVQRVLLTVVLVRSYCEALWEGTNSEETGAESGG